MVADECRAATWTQDTELLAGILETLIAIAQRLNAGVPVVMQKQTGKIKPTTIPRPDWLPDPQPKVTTLTPAEMFRRFRR